MNLGLVSGPELNSKITFNLDAWKQPCWRFHDPYASKAIFLPSKMKLEFSACDQLFKKKLPDYWVRTQPKFWPWYPDHSNLPVAIIFFGESIWEEFQFQLFKISKSQICRISPWIKKSFWFDYSPLARWRYWDPMNTRCLPMQSSFTSCQISIWNTLVYISSGHVSV